MASIEELCKASLGNGRVIYGFVSTVDKGLDQSEFILTARELGDSVLADEMKVQESDSDALVLDAERVDSFDIPGPLKPLVLASRWYTVQMGYLVDEAELVPTKGKGRARSSDPGKEVPDLVKRALDLPMGTATLPIYITTVCYYNSNHNTGGLLLPKGHIKAVRAALGLGREITDQEITRAVYLGGHAADKRKSLVSFAGLERHLAPVQGRGNYVSAEFDSWAQVRSKVHPAGTHAVGALLVVLKYLTDLGLSGFTPVPQAISVLTAAVKDMEEEPWKFHPGAKYLFNCDPLSLANVEEVKAMIGVFGGFCNEMGACRSIYAAAQYRELANNLADAKWTALGRKLSASLEVSEGQAQAAIAASGQSLFEDVPNPVDNAEAYGFYNARNAATLVGIAQGW